MRILIVEDSLTLINLYKNIIKTLRPTTNFEIITVTNCNDYFNYYKDYKFDLALVVWKLHSCDTLSIIKNIDKNTLLYIVSGKDNVEDVRGIAVQYGGAIKVKPITIDDLDEMLSKLGLKGDVCKKAIA